RHHGSLRLRKIHPPPPLRRPRPIRIRLHRNRRPKTRNHVRVPTYRLSPPTHRRHLPAVQPHPHSLRFRKHRAPPPARQLLATQDERPHQGTPHHPQNRPPRRPPPRRPLRRRTTTRRHRPRPRHGSSRPLRR